MRLQLAQRGEQLLLGPFEERLLLVCPDLDQSDLVEAGVDEPSIGRPSRNPFEGAANAFEDRATSNMDLPFVVTSLSVE